MAEIIQNEGAQKGKRRSKRTMGIIDMTPMVDLACLLLTFFMLTTIFVKPKVMDIVLPKNELGGEPIPGIRTINIILDDNNIVYWYNGLADAKKGPLPILIRSTFEQDGIRKMLLNRNKELFLKIDEVNQDGITAIKHKDNMKLILNLKRKDKKGPIVLIKASEKVKYGNMVDIIDEMAICNIARYAIVNLTANEKTMLENARRNAIQKSL